MTISQFNAPTCNAIAKEFEEFCKAFAEKHGLDVKRTSGKFTKTSFTQPMEFTIRSSDGKPAGKDAEAFTMMAELWGMTADDLGAEFAWRGQKARIIGARSRKEKMPIMIEVGPEKAIYVIATASAKAALAQARATAH